MDDCPFIIFTGENPYCFHVLEHRYCAELNFTAQVSAQKVSSAKAFYPVDAGKNFGFEHSLVFVGVLCFGPSVPDSAYHLLISFSLGESHQSLNPMAEAAFTFLPESSELRCQSGR